MINHPAHGLKLGSAALTLICLAGAPQSAHAYIRERPTPKHLLQHGVMYGKVVDLTGKPVANATVALQQPNGKVLAWTKTDAKGEYSLPADPKLALNLRPSHSKGLLEQCVDAVGEVAMIPVRVVGSTVTNPGAVVKSAAVSVASGTPAPLAAQAVQSSLPSGTAGQTTQAAGGAVAGTALTNTKGTLPAESLRGGANILITATGYKNANVTDAAYWLDPPNEDKHNPIGVQAWLETIRIAPTAGDKAGDVVPEAVTLSDGDAEPALVPVGGDLDLKVKLNSPTPDTTHKARVFARLASKDTVVELLPVANQAGIYSGKMHIDAKTPPGQTTVSIGALRAVPVEVKLNPKKPDPLGEFVRRLDDMNAAKTYGYDPFVMASENRLDLKLTILPAKTG